MLILRFESLTLRLSQCFREMNVKSMDRRWVRSEHDLIHCVVTKKNKKSLPSAV